MTKKQFLRMFLFLGLTFGMVSLLFYIFQSNQNDNPARRWNGFYAEENNSLDGVFLGASMVDRAWISPMAWNDSGIAVYPVSTGGFPISATTSVMAEILKTQDPDVFIIDVHGVRSYSPYATQSDLRNLVDSMSYLSPNRINAFKKVAAFNDAYEAEFGEVTPRDDSPSAAKPVIDWSYYLPFINYHARWETGLSRADFAKTPHKYKGANDLRSRMTAVNPKNYPEQLTDESDLPVFFQNIILEIIDYAEQKDLNVLFIQLPSVLNEQLYKELNGALELAQNAGFDTLNMNTAECYSDLKLDFSGDFKDSVHLNAKGAVKVTQYLTQYLQEHYDIKDKRNDPRYESWDIAWDNYQILFENLWGFSIDEYQAEIE